MFYVYLLRSKKDGRLYSGYTNNLKERVRAHTNKEVYSTSRMGNLDLIFYEAFNNSKDAKRREKYFKTTKGKRSVKLMLKYS